MRRAALTAAAVLMASAAFAASAFAGTVTAQSGRVQATLSFTTSHGTKLANRLTIARDGVKLLDQRAVASTCNPGPCPIDAYPEEPALRVRDLDGDGEPEVLFTAYTGGAHCCTVVRVYRLAPDGMRYLHTDRDFADPGFTLHDLGHDGRVEWLSRDPRFEYLYTAYAFSGTPVEIWRYSHGRFTDVTRRFPARVRADARMWWRTYRGVARRRDGTELGPVSAWAADEYLLGARAHALRVLRSEAAHGRLRGPDLSGRRFVTSLDRFLRTHGYG